MADLNDSNGNYDDNDEVSVMFIINSHAKNADADTLKKYENGISNFAVYVHLQRNILYIRIEEG